MASREATNVLSADHGSSRRGGRPHEEQTRDSPSLSPVIGDDEEDPNGFRSFDLEGGGDDDEDDRERNLALAMGAGEPIRRQISMARITSRDSRMSGRDVAADKEKHAATAHRSPDPNSIREAPNEAETSHSTTPVTSHGDSDPGKACKSGGGQRPCQEKPKPLALSLKGKILHFTPSWFSVTMGTGVIASLLNLLGQIWGTEQYSPGFASFVRWPALVFLILDIAIFLVFASAFIARYILFPKVLFLTVTHPQQSMFLGTVPMGLVTITSNISQLGTKSFGLGQWPSFVALVLWFICALMSLATAAGVPWSIITFQKQHRFEGTTAALLLPIVPPITVAASGSVLMDNLGDLHPTLSFTIMAVSYMQLGIGLPLALMVLVIYLQRLILFKAPPREVIVSVFLPLGPCGQGGEAALHLGRAAMHLFPTISRLPNTGVPQLTFGVGEALYGSGLVVALLLFALGMWWAIIGVATFLNEYFRGYLKFNMGFWSFTFPLGSLCLCTARLAMELDSLTLKIVYTIMTLCNFALYIYVAIPTVKGFVSGRLLVAPCIIDLPIDPLTEKM